MTGPATRFQTDAEFLATVDELEPLDQLVALSRRFGADPEIVLAGGGNTSLKIGSHLHVKASGVALADIDRDGFVELDREQLLQLSASEPPDDPAAREAEFKERVLAARIHPDLEQRPSVECVLHELMPRAFVVHTHATLVNAVTCCRDGEGLAADLFGDDPHWLPYVDPGFALAIALRDALEQKRGEASTILMANHGLVVAGDSPREIVERTSALLAACRERVGDWPRGAFGGREAPELSEERAVEIADCLAGSFSSPDAPARVARDASELALDFVGAPRARGATEAGPLTPDQIVYCGSFPMWFPVPSVPTGLDLRTRLGVRVVDHLRTTGGPPKVVLVPGAGVFGIGESDAMAAAARDLYVDAIKVMAAAESLGGVRHLTRRQRRFIEDWEVEAYRRRVAAGGARPADSAGL